MQRFFNKTFAAFLDEVQSLEASGFISRQPNLSSQFTGANQMIRDLGLEPADADKPDKVEQYIDFLAGFYDLVMITEHMEESLVLLRHLLGLDLLDIVSLPINRQRPASSDGDPLANLTGGQQSALTMLNAADHALYRRFCEVFENKLANFGPHRMKAELDAYR
jgi:hypothetical protein